jgi:hypothetical protein
MATPRVILRFREVTPHIDTIQEHLAVLKAKGFVWWGWWKKKFEADRLADLARLQQAIKREGAFQAWLIDTSAERLHLATVTDIRFRLSGSDIEAVPAYYRGAISEIPAWFRLSEIKVDQRYRSDIEEKIGQDTLAVYEPAS